MKYLKSISCFTVLLLSATVITAQTNSNDDTNGKKESFVILHEQQDEDEGILRREFEHLKTFLANNMPMVNVISNWISPSSRRMVFDESAEKERSMIGRSVIDDTMNVIYNRLIDYGFHSVGISDSCRELAICNTSNYVLTQMPAFLEAYGRERLMNFPTSVFGNHDYTNAWIVGLSSAEPSFCPSLFACDNNDQPSSISVTEMPNMATVKIPIQMNQQTAYYVSNANEPQQPKPPLMLLIEVIQPGQNNSKRN